MSIFGLDIGSVNIKVVQVQKQGDKFKIITAGLSPSPHPGITSESEKDLVDLAAAVKKLCQEAKITTREVVAALPESEVFTRVVEMPIMNENELMQAVPWEAEQFVPIPLNQVTLDWQVVSRRPSNEGVEKIKVFLVAAPTAVIQKYQRVIELAGLQLVALETEIIALSRALVPLNSPPTILIDLGAKTTDLAIISNGEVALTRSVPTAGEAFTRAISSNLALDPLQAEEYKVAYGMVENQLEGKIRKVLAPVFDALIIEVKKAIGFWQEKGEPAIGKIMVTGGTANLPQLTTYLAQSIGIELEVADPFTTLVADEKILASLRPNAPLFATAVGLAEKEI